MKWFLIACMATAAEPCEERLKMQIAPEIGERAYVETLCSEILAALEQNKLKPTEFRCDYVGGTKPRQSFDSAQEGKQ